jgi:sugar lactone lactonase YvrE
MEPHGAFINYLVEPGAGGLSNPQGLTFGRDGSLYVSSFNTNQVLRYDGSTGASLGVFASGGGLVNPNGLAFGPDGNLYLSSCGANAVKRYRGTTGAYMGDFAPGGGLKQPTFLTFK